MAPELLEVEGLSVVAGGQPPAPLVTEVSFRLERGIAVGLVGESGSGKTMTARALIDLLPPGCVRAAGRFTLGGERLDTLGVRRWRWVRGRRIGYVFQEPVAALNPVRTIGSQLVEAIRAHRPLSAAAARRRAGELLERVALAEGAGRLDDYPHQFSGGQAQRIGIALALAAEPELLIADEPTTALDVTVQAEIVELLRQLRRKLDLTLLLITHDLGVVSALCDEVLVMYGGRIVERGATRGVLERPAHPYTRGLLAVVPRLGRVTERGRLPAIAGTVPSPESLPSGCSFHPRCPEVMPHCDAAVPPESRLTGGRRVCCFLYTPEARAAVESGP